MHNNIQNTLIQFQFSITLIIHFIINFLYEVKNNTKSRIVNYEMSLRR